MSFDGDGTFTVINTFVYDTVISETEMNANFADVAAGLSTCITKDGQTTVTANIPMSGHKITSIGDGQAKQDAAALHQIQNQDGIWCGTAGGTANALTINPAPAITAYVAGQKFRFIAAANNTGAATVAVSGLTAKGIQLYGLELGANNIVAGKIYELDYDGIQFQLTQASLGVTPFAKTLLDDPSAATALSTLGVSDYSQTLLDDANADAAKGTLRLQVDGLGALQALTGQVAGERVYLTYRSTEDDGAHGVFRWDASNLSTAVAADTQKGSYVPPNTDTTGASGAWVREHRGSVSIKWFGATGDGVTDDTVAIQGAIDYVWSLGGGTVFFPAGDYYANSIVLKDYVQCVGEGYKTRIFHPTQNLFVNLGIHPDNYSSRTYYSASDISQGDNVITLLTPSDTANFTIGELAILRSSGQLVSGALVLPYHAEIIKVTDIDAIAGTITVEHAIEYDITSPLLAVAESSLGDNFVQYAGIRNMYLDAANGGGAGIRSRAAYKCKYQDLWIRSLYPVLGNGFCHCLFENIVGIDFTDRVIELKTGSLNTSVINMQAYVSPTATTLTNILIDLGEYANGLTVKNVEVFLGNATLNNGLISFGSTCGSNHLVSGIKVHGGILAFDVIAIFGQDDFDSQNITVENVEVDAASITGNGIKIDANSSTANSVKNVTFRNIRLNTPATSRGLRIDGANYVDNIRLENIDTGGIWRVFAGVTANISIDGGSYDSIGTLASPVTMRNVNVRGSVYPGVYVGIGSPEGVITAAVGSLYQRKDGAAATSLYVKESGTGNTGWVAK